MLRFGTDGVRGDAETDLTDGFLLALGRALARVFPEQEFLIGRDTRISGERIVHSLWAGIHRGHATAVALGVMPTPAIAFSAAQTRQPAVIVSASHNPWADNGVKVIGADGSKLSDETEAAIERELEAALALGTSATTNGDDAPNFATDRKRGDTYLAHLLQTLAGRTLGGLSIVLDCANGAGFQLAPRVFREAGAEVRVLHAEPDGRNINADCGSTHPESLQRAVEEHGAHVGLALDGDADRVLAVDERGALVDGDQIMTMCALDLRARGALAGNALVVTVMSNLGLRHAMRDAGIEVVETPVGDRHVVAAMQTGGYAIGGEQSGHVVFAQHATTGDGLLTGLVLCDLVRRSGQPLSALAAQMTRYPQVLVNVRVGRVDLEHAPALWDAVRRVESELGDDGRVLVRASGTEPVVRVMVEAASSEVADVAAAELTAVVRAEFGPS